MAFGTAQSLLFCNWNMHVSSLVFVVLQILCLQHARGQLELRVAYITTNAGQYVSNGTIPAVELAVEKVNEVFADRFRLNMTTSSISCGRSDALESYFSVLKAGGPPLIALLGCGCSPATEPVAEVSGFSDIVHISYVSSSPVLSDRSRFPSFWRTYPSDSSVSSAVVAVVKQYGWKQLKILTQRENLFIETSQTLKMEFINNDIHVDENGTIDFSSTETFKAISGDMLFSEEVRVFLLDMYEVQARRVLCQAFKQGDSDSRYVSGFVWLIHGWYKLRWWTAEVAQDSEVDCTDDQLEQLLRRSLAILQIPTADNTTAPTDVELSAGEFRSEYDARLRVNPSEPSAALSYDAVWTLALALQQSNVTNETSTSIAVEIREVLSSNFTFTGVSGKVEFDVNGTRLPHDTRIFQYRDTSTAACRARGAGGMQFETVPVAVVAVNERNLTYLCGPGDCACETDMTIWPEGVPPDGIPKKVITTIQLPVFIIYAILATAGIVFVIVCLVFNLVFRERKIVKLTSPNLNYIILLGAVMLYSSVFFYVLPSKDERTTTVYCHVRAWLQPGGYLLCFGTVMLKMWRVYYIFHNPSARKKRTVPKDWMLALAALVMFSVVPCIMIVVLILDDYKGTEVEDQETNSARDDNNILVEHYNLVCDGRNSLAWIAVIYVYVVGTQVAAVYLAFRTRKVKIKALNDAKYLALIIYINTIIITAMVIGALSLDKFLNADAAVFCTCLVVFTTLILGLLFVPKMVILHKDPRGERIFGRSMSQAQPTLTGMSLNDSEREKLHDLEVHCRDLESKLGKYETVQPFRRSLSKSKLMSGSTDLNYSLQLTTSIAKPPLTTNGVDYHSPTLHTNGYSSTSPGCASTGEVEMSAVKPSHSPTEIPEDSAKF